MPRKPTGRPPGRPRKRAPGQRTAELLAWLAENKNAATRDIIAAGFGPLWLGSARRRLIAADAIRARINHDDTGRRFLRYRIGTPYASPIRKSTRKKLTPVEREKLVIKGAITTLQQRGFKILPPTRMITKPETEK